MQQRKINITANLDRLRVPHCRKMAQISAPFLLQCLPQPGCRRGCVRQASVAPQHHLIGSQPSREWEIVSLKIGCPLFWLSPRPSLRKGTGLAVQGKTSRKAAASVEGAGRYFWRWRSGMGCYRGDAQHRAGGSLPDLPLLGKSNFHHL